MDDADNIRERIQYIMKVENLSQAAFANLLGISRSNLHHVLSGRNRKPSLDLIQKIMKTFPKINPTWLLLGEGKMFLDTQENQAKISQPTLFDTPVTTKKKTIVPETERTTTEKNIQETADETISNEPKTNAEISSKNTDNEKKTETENHTVIRQEPQEIIPQQVIIFYPDKTFEIFRPKN